MTQEKINEILTYLLDVMKQTGDLAKHELPLVAKEVVNFEIFSSVNWIIFESILSVVVILIIVRLKKVVCREKTDPAIPFIGILLFVISLAVNSWCLFNEFQTLGKCYFAPRIVIFEKLKGYVK